MIETYASTKNGELIFHTKISSLLRPLEGKELVVTIKTRRGRRTLGQNDYYWAMLRRISDATGNDTQDIHEFCKRKFLPPKVLVINDKQFLVVAHTPDQNTQEFWEYCEKIRAFFATEFNIHLEDQYMQ